MSVGSFHRVEQVLFGDVVAGQLRRDDAAAQDEEPEEPEEPTEEERLEQLGERIDKARSQAEDSGVIGDEGEDDEREFADSGATEDQDDQEIAPPG
jgi:hypothetical protein